MALTETQQNTILIAFKTAMDRYNARESRILPNQANLNICRDYILTLPNMNMASLELDFIWTLAIVDLDALSKLERPALSPEAQAAAEALEKDRRDREKAEELEQRDRQAGRDLSWMSHGKQSPENAQRAETEAAEIQRELALVPTVEAIRERELTPRQLERLSKRQLKLYIDRQREAQRLNREAGDPRDNKPTILSQEASEVAAVIGPGPFGQEQVKLWMRKTPVKIIREIRKAYPVLAGRMDVVVAGAPDPGPMGALQ
jgi:hypothetical protein